MFVYPYFHVFIFAFGEAFKQQGVVLRLRMALFDEVDLGIIIFFCEKGHDQQHSHPYKAELQVDSSLKRKSGWEDCDLCQAAVLTAKEVTIHDPLRHEEHQ